ncbi:MAG TPA: hypothetical protein VJZ03_07240 [Candidatus Bathyarchaeia archaeon]|nr:hypothetical protein [Candidatus Bathyarchaeia archaeon]
MAKYDVVRPVPFYEIVDNYRRIANIEGDSEHIFALMSHSYAVMLPKKAQEQLQKIETGERISILLTDSLITPVRVRRI